MVNAYAPLTLMGRAKILPFASVTKSRKTGFRLSTYAFTAGYTDKSLQYPFWFSRSIANPPAASRDVYELTYALTISGASSPEANARATSSALALSMSESETTATSG